MHTETRHSDRKNDINHFLCGDFTQTLYLSFYSISE